MEELVERLATVRDDDTLSRAVADLFDKRPGKAEFKAAGAAQFTMSCIPVMMDYAME